MLAHIAEELSPQLDHGAWFHVVDLYLLNHSEP